MLSLYKDLHIHSSVANYFKVTRSVSALGYEKCFVSKGRDNIQTYFSRLKWNKLFLDLAFLVSRQLPLRHVFSARFPGVVLLGWDDLVIPRHFQRLITEKISGVDPGRPRNLQRRKVEVLRWPKKSDKTANSSQQWIQEERQKQHSNHHGGLYMTEQFKHVTNAQESKIFLK